MTDDKPRPISLIGMMDHAGWMFKQHASAGPTDECKGCPEQHPPRGGTLNYGVNLWTSVRTISDFVPDLKDCLNCAAQPGVVNPPVSQSCPIGEEKLMTPRETLVAHELKEFEDALYLQLGVICRKMEFAIINSEQVIPNRPGGVNNEVRSLVGAIHYGGYDTTIEFHLDGTGAGLDLDREVIRRNSSGRQISLLLE